MSPKPPDEYGYIGPIRAELSQLRARISALENAVCRTTAPVNHICLDKEQDRILKELDVIDGTYASHQNWSQKDKDRKKLLTVRLQEIRKMLGIKF